MAAGNTQREGNHAFQLSGSYSSGLPQKCQSAAFPCSTSTARSFKPSPAKRLMGPSAPILSVDSRVIHLPINFFISLAILDRMLIRLLTSSEEARSRVQRI